MRVDRLGRIDSFQIVEQAPGRVFESAVIRSLFMARLPPDSDAEPLRELKTAVTFLMPGESAPAWAEQRMAATASSRPPVAIAGVSQA
jgi:hypothetical protein